MGCFSLHWGSERTGAVFAASGKWWFYFAVAIPLLVAVMVVMMFYRRKHEALEAQSSRVILSDAEAQLSRKKQGRHLNRREMG